MDMTFEDIEIGTYHYDGRIIEVVGIYPAELGERKGLILDCECGVSGEPYVMHSNDIVHINNLSEWRRG